MTLWNPFAKLPSPVTLSLLCELTRIAPCDTSTTGKISKNLWWGLRYILKRKLRGATYRTLRCVVDLKVCSNTMCIVKVAMFWVWLNVAKGGISLWWTETERIAKFCLLCISQKFYDDQRFILNLRWVVRHKLRCVLHRKVGRFFFLHKPFRLFVFLSQNLQIFCLALRKRAQYVVV